MRYVSCVFTNMSFFILLQYYIFSLLFAEVTEIVLKCLILYIPEGQWMPMCCEWGHMAHVSLPPSLGLITHTMGCLCFNGHAALRSGSAVDPGQPQECTGRCLSNTAGCALLTTHSATRVTPRSQLCHMDLCLCVRHLHGLQRAQGMGYKKDV